MVAQLQNINVEQSQLEAACSTQDSLLKITC